MGFPSVPPPEQRKKLLKCSHQDICIHSVGAHLKKRVTKKSGYSDAGTHIIAVTYNSSNEPLIKIILNITYLM